MPLLRRDGFASGFSAALGVATLLVLLLLGYFLLKATAAVIAPFVGAMVVALLLDPLVDRVQTRLPRGRRLPAVLVVFLLFLLVFGGFLFLIVPRLIGQAQGLALRFPEYVETARTGINTYLLSHREIAGITLPENSDQLVEQYSAQAAAFLRASAGHIAAVIAGSVSRLLSVVLVPIIAFYLLSDFDRLRARLFFLLPDRFREGFRRTTLDVGIVFGSYVRGLVLVCSAYAVSAVMLLLFISLWFPGLRGYALLLGVAAGLLYAVPYVGALVTVLLTAVVALATGGGVPALLAAAGCLLVLNQIFDNGVMPRVVGGGVGLHPVVSLFALLLGGQLFGLWGMLLSVPIAGSVQVVLYRLFPRLATPTPLLYLHSGEAIAERRAAIAAERLAAQQEQSAAIADDLPPASHAARDA